MFTLQFERRGMIIHAFVTSKEKEISKNECKTNKDNLHSSALSKIDAHYQFYITGISGRVLAFILWTNYFCIFFRFSGFVKIQRPNVQNNQYQ